MARKLIVEIIGDARSFEKALGRSAEKTRTFSKSVETASRFATLALGGLGIAAAAGLAELSDAQKETAQTEAVLKSTGQAAGVTKRHVLGLADSLSKLSGVDDEVVQSAENVLLTFTNIGKAGGVFDRATKAALDMSTALGTDLESATIQVGKALNDPIRGLTALRRVGVSFTDAQRDQIRALVESGRTMDAQKVILKELEKEFGGSAKAAGDTFAGQVNKLKNQLAETTAELVTALMPALQLLVKTIATATAFMSKHQTVVKVAAAALVALAAAVLAVNAALKVYRAALVVATAAQWLLNAALTANPIGIVVVALGALAAGFVIAWKRSETFRRIVTATFNALKRIVLSFANVYLTFISKFLGGIAALAEGASHIPGVGDKFKGVANSIRGAQERVDALRDSIKKLNATPVKSRVSAAGLSDVASSGARNREGPNTTTVNVNLDGRQIARVVTENQQKRGKAMPNSRSGRHAGLGFAG